MVSFREFEYTQSEFYLKTITLRIEKDQKTPDLLGFIMINILSLPSRLEKADYY